MNHVAGIMSMLHEPADWNSATRRFRNKPVVQWTANRISRGSPVDSLTLLCWDDQVEAAASAVGDHEVIVLSKGTRQALAGMDAITTARRWADGWRGGLLGTCEFDLGFHPHWVQEIAVNYNADAVLLIDPAAALIDPVLVGDLIAHADAEPTAELCFSPAAPGLSATLLRRALVDRLTVAKIHPGRLVTYWPDQHGVDPIGKQGCAPVPTPVARSVHRFKLDSDRQIDRINRATISLNGHLISTEAEELAVRMNAVALSDELPREVVLEINTKRATNPVFWPGDRLGIVRDDLRVDVAQKLFAEIATLDDIRLTLGGVGDPLLCDGVFEIIAAAKSAGVHTVGIETDLQTTDASMLKRLVESGVDVISVFTPAATPPTYQAVMNVDGFGRTMDNIRILELEVAAYGKGFPLIAPIFVKTSANLAEMEAWYDYWIRRVGHAVITGPSDYAGLIPDVAVADMAPPKRRPCARLNSRVTILSNGQVVSCEQDVLGKQAMGTITETSLKEMWQERFSALRACHQMGDWNSKPMCAGCREWHRP